LLGNVKEASDVAEPMMRMTEKLETAPLRDFLWGPSHAIAKADCSYLVGGDVFSVRFNDGQVVICNAECECRQSRHVDDAQTVPEAGRTDHHSKAEACDGKGGDFTAERCCANRAVSL
jgi:hypothetical protein